MLGILLVVVAPPENYLFLSEPVAELPARLRSHPEIRGFQVVYTWRSLETAKDRYDFSAIERDLSAAQTHRKRLFVQLQDRFFSPEDRNVPDYLLREPRYEGGLEPQVDNPGEGQPLGSGWVAKQWNPAVRERFQRLIRALAKRFDGKIAGINLPETAADVDLKRIDLETYFRAELENVGVARRSFRKSHVVQYINFWPGEWENDHNFMERAFAFAAKHRIGLGGPDIVPYRPGQMKNSYPWFHRYRGKLSLVAMAVQEPTLTYTNPATGKPFTREEVVDFAQDYLGANIIFWTPQSPWLLSTK